jgi:hypothetical protein
VIASRLSEDPSCKVALIEAGETARISSLPIAPPTMQLNPATDWMYTVDPGKAGLGLNGRRVLVPRGRCSACCAPARRRRSRHLSLEVSVRDPKLPAARQFVEAMVAVGIQRGDYNGRDRGGGAGLVSMGQMTWHGRRRSLNKSSPQANRSRGRT